MGARKRADGKAIRSSIIRLSIIALLLASCTGKDGTFDTRKPYSLDLTPPEGPYEYEQGWTDGCESGMQAYAADFYKSIRAFTFRQDENLRTNKMYYQAWKDAFLYCAEYIDAVNTHKL